jgi:hypothetical protein
MSEELTERDHLRGFESKHEDNIKIQLGEIGSIHLNWLGQNSGFYEQAIDIQIP